MDILKTSRRVRLAILAATTLTLFQLVFAPTDAWLYLATAVRLAA